MSNVSCSCGCGQLVPLTTLSGRRHPQPLLAHGHTASLEQTLLYETVVAHELRAGDIVSFYESDPHRCHSDEHVHVVTSCTMTHTRDARHKAYYLLRLRCSHDECSTHARCIWPRQRLMRRL